MKAQRKPARSRNNRFRRSRRLQFEALDKREMMDASAVLSNAGVLTVDAGPQGADADVLEMWNTLFFRSRNSSGAMTGFKFFNKGDVKKIVFNGSNHADKFTNYTDIEDQILGHGGNDQLTGGRGYSHIEGGSGNDTIRGGGGNDDLWGGANRDTIHGDAGEDTIHGDAGNDRLIGGDDGDEIWGGSGQDVISGARGNDEIHGGSESDTISGGADTDRVWGDAGNDVIYGDDIMGYTADDYLYGGAGDDQLYGFGGNDTLDGGSDNDRLFGGGGNDVIHGGSGDDILEGGTGNDQLHGENDSDTLVGAQGDDYLEGGHGNDSLDGGKGHDRLAGGRGDDDLLGGTGSDIYLFDVDTPLGHDTLQETNTGFSFLADRDTLDFSEGSTGVVVDIYRTARQTAHPNLSLTLGSSFAIENVIGTKGDDTLLGNQWNNRLEGRGGDDFLNGFGGDDTYVFDADVSLGADTLRDYSGSNTLDFSLTWTTGIVLDLGKTVQVVTKNLALTLWSAFHNVVGSVRGDTITGNALDNQLIGGLGNDTLVGLKGDDTLEGGAGNDVLDGGEGDNLFVFAGNRLGRDTITGSTGHNTVDFRRHSSSITVDLQRTSQQKVSNQLSLTLQHARAVDDVMGSKYGDEIWGNDLDNRIEGFGGSDIVHGRRGNDSLWGGAGNDFLYGDEHMDRLIGGLGTDILFGGGGNDGLYGGGDAVRDYLHGETGEDRFLTRGGDSVQDLRRGDVQVRFVDGSSRWTDREIAVVDQAFAELQARAGSTRILDDPASTHPLEFIKERNHGQYRGANSEWEFLFWFDRDIRIVDWNEYSEDANREFRGVVIHEIAHNWDESAEQNPFWSVFSSAHQRSDSDDDFAQSVAREDTVPYGSTDPREDWATVWQVYFGYETGGDSSLFREKLAIVDAFFRYIA